MSTVYILCGKIACGKSYVASKIQQEKKAIILSYDELMLKMFDECIGPQAHLEASLRISDYYAPLCDQIIRQNIDVVLDYGFWSIYERNYIKQRLDDLHIAYTLVHITCNESVRYLRLHQRNSANHHKDGRQYIMNDEQVALFDQRFEDIQVHEQFVEYKNDNNI